MHLRTHENEKSFICEICKTVFSQKGNLKRHLLVHTQEKPYVCDTCKKAFIQNSNLKTHLRIHTEEKPYVCDNCNMAFSDYSAFKNHLRIHTKEKPYACDFCKKAFSRSSNWKRHLRVHTIEKPYICHICNKAFSTNVTLKEHFRVHTKEKPYKLLGAVDTRRYPRAENRVWSDQEDHEERGSKDRAATLVDPTVTRSTIRADVGVAIVPQKISRYLAEANLKSKRPFRALPLTPEHRQLRLQWCQARSTWNVTDWQKVVFSNESWFVFGTDDNRVRVLRRPGERYNPSHTVPRHTARTACVMVWGAIAYNSRST
ncbi:zinc finger protein 233 [Trichonephila clavipes]|nr:zinc finger protein 233 [Trichonephila clavipes]